MAARSLPVWGQVLLPSGSGLAFSHAPRCRWRRQDLTPTKARP